MACVDYSAEDMTPPVAWTQRRGHGTAGRLEEGGVERGNPPRPSFTGRHGATATQTRTQTFPKAALGKLMRDREERVWAFLST